MGKGKKKDEKPKGEGEKRPNPLEEVTEGLENLAIASVSGVSQEGEVDLLAFDAVEKNQRSKVPKDRNGNAEDSLAKFERLRLNTRISPAFCFRPEFANGKSGKKIAILTNFFRLKLKGATVHQYDVAFLKPDQTEAVKKEQEVGRRFRRVTKRIHRSLLATFVETTGRDLFRGISYSYDNGHILITNRPLPDIQPDGSVFNFVMIDDSRDPPTPQRYFIRIKSTNNLSLEFDPYTRTNQDRAVLQMLDIITKTYAFQYNIVYGPKIFFSAEDRERFAITSRNGPSPFELSIGYHQSTRFCQGGPMQNIDRAAAVFFRGGPLIDTMSNLVGRDLRGVRLTHNDLETLKDLAGIRVQTQYRGYTAFHTIRSFTPTPCNSTYFTSPQGRESVYGYFSREYAVNWINPMLPCVIYGENKYLPIEVCHVPSDQRNQRKLRDDLIASVNRYLTQQNPFGRLREIVHSAETIADQRVLDQFGTQLVPEPVEVQGRLLKTPGLEYKNPSNNSSLAYTPEMGDWRMTGKKLIQPINLTRWALFAFGTRKITEFVAESFVKHIRRTGDMLGMQITKPLNPYQFRTTENLSAWLEEWSKKNLQLIVALMPEDNEYYSLIKSLADQRLGIPTQIVLDKHYNLNKAFDDQTLFKPAYLFNLLLKMNMKIGGSNLKLLGNNQCSLLGDQTMVVGIDVNHPAPGEQSPSIAAVVGSLDPGFSQYHTEIQVNRPTVESVRVSQMIVPILQAFKARRTYYPENILVYRDGVSEGEFASVLQGEIFPLLEELETLCPDRQPKLTYMIVQKRHNARFFPKDRKNSTRSGNILPGSVIDTEICHYKWFDFYLCSHNSFLGTARSGKYTVLWHSSPGDADELQKATYYLCYLFARATKSIADPAPARYAHHAAARGKIYLREILRANPELLRRDWSDQLEGLFNQRLSVNDSLRNILYFA